MCKRSEPLIDSSSSGLLSENELSQIRELYERGCVGEIVLGLRDDQRIVTMLLPETNAYAPARLSAIRAELRRLGCDRMQWVRKSLSKS